MEELKTSRMFLLITSILMVGCSGISKQDAQTAAQTTQSAADICQGLADLHGRSDIAAYCATAGGIASVMDRLLSEASECKVPTTAAGAEVPADAGSH